MKCSFRLAPTALPSVPRQMPACTTPLFSGRRTSQERPSHGRVYTRWAPGILQAIREAHVPPVALQSVLREMKGNLSQAALPELKARLKAAAERFKDTPIRHVLRSKPEAPKKLPPLPESGFGDRTLSWAESHWNEHGLRPAGNDAHGSTIYIDNNGRHYDDLGNEYEHDFQQNSFQQISGGPFNSPW